MVLGMGEPQNIQGLARRRVLVGTGAGIVTLAIALLVGASWSVSVLVGWDTLTLVFLGWVWATIMRKDAKGTQRLAMAEDDSRAASDGLILGASVVSLVAIFFTLAEASKSGGGDAVLLAALAVFSIVLGWAVIQTTFTLIYARVYYTPPSGGVDFEDGDPDFRDLAYMAFTIGMTYQVSDTGISQKRIRHIVLRHAILSFIFGTTIIAVAINAVANLVR
jgi:uncharacterized membrane protein